MRSGISFGTVLIIYCVAVFLFMCSINEPIEEYDGNNRRLVADSLWNNEPLQTTWFDFGSILSLYLFYFPAFALKGLFHFNMPLHNISILLHSTLFVSLISGVMWIALAIFIQQSQRIYERKVILILTLLFTFCCNPLIFSAERYHIETPLAFYLTALYVLFSRQQQESQQSARMVLFNYALLIGLTGMAILTRSPSFMFILPFAIFYYCKRMFKIAIPLSLGLILGFLGCIWWNYFRFKEIFGYAYGVQGFDANPVEGMYAFLFSPGLGIMIFYPISILAIKRLITLTIHGDKFHAVTLFGIVAYSLVFAHWCVYNGGQSYGPRFLLPLLPILGIIGYQELINMSQQLLKYSVILLLCLWGLYINFNSVLMPNFYHFHQWRSSADIWEMPAREKQINLDYAERLAIYDPYYSHYLGNIKAFFSRFDLWELPMLEFKQREMQEVYNIFPQKPLYEFSIISRGSKSKRWIFREIKCFDAEKCPILFNLVPDPGFENINFAQDNNHQTYCQGPKIYSGLGLHFRLKTVQNDPFLVEIDYGNRHFEHPFTVVVQKRNGKYFRGNLNDRSYIPFKKRYKTRNIIEGVTPRIWLFILGILLFAISIFFLTLIQNRIHRCI